MNLSKKDKIFILTLCCALPWVTNCEKLPDNTGRTPTHAISGGEDTTLGRDFSELIKDQDPKHSGVLLLKHGLDAFVGRALLASLAESSIDVQYYMFHQDTVGKILFLKFRELFRFKSL